MSYKFFNEEWNNDDDKVDGYTRGHLSQLGRRNMLEKEHTPKNQYKRKPKHKNKGYE